MFPDPPGPPVNVQANDITVSSCTLTWEEPEFDGGSPVTGYLVEKQNGYSSRWSKVNKNPTSEMIMKLNDLEEGAEYEYRVSAVNDAGTGKPSGTTGRFKAKNPYDPPGKPEAPIVDDIMPEEADLSWAPPTDDGGSPIIGYNVEMRPKGETKWKPATKDEVTDPKLKVTGLKEGVEYEFRVAAVNKAGPGSASAPTKAKYGEDGCLIKSIEMK